MRSFPANGEAWAEFGSLPLTGKGVVFDRRKNGAVNSRIALDFANAVEAIVPVNTSRQLADAEVSSWVRRIHFRPSAKWEIPIG